MQRLRGQRGLGTISIILLIFGFLLASVLIFIFGFALGQEMALRHTLQNDNVVRATAPSRPPTPTPSVGVGGVYKEMDQKAYERAEGTEVRPPSPTVAPPIASPTAPRMASPTQPPRPTATKHRPTPTIPRPPAAGQTQDDGTRWSIQVGATKSSQEAVNLMLELRRLGFQAYTAQAQLGAETSYRVRVGHFVNRAEAEAVEKKLHEDSRFSGAYVTSQ